jgi:predicted amino acid-binding ACT domain protein
MSAPSPTLLQLSGKDAPGITSEVMRLLDEAQAEILDLHQTVIHGSLRMSLLVRVTDGAGLLKKLEKKSGRARPKTPSRNFARHRHRKRASDLGGDHDRLADPAPRAAGREPGVCAEWI